MPIYELQKFYCEFPTSVGLVKKNIIMRNVSENQWKMSNGTCGIQLVNVFYTTNSVSTLAKAYKLSKAVLLTPLQSLECYIKFKKIPGGKFIQRI